MVEAKDIPFNPHFASQEFWAELVNLFIDRPEAHEFVLHYGEYIENIDDLVDEPKDVERVKKVTEQAARLFNSPYWKKWGDKLYLLERITHLTYFDSVCWESADEEWKRWDAKCLSHCGYNMLFAIILIEFGEDKLRSISLRFREHAHLRHINDPI